nr:MAG TPA: hyaluronidase [Caudoviricetes sp.]
MAQKVINTRHQLSRDTSANWTASDPVLLDGEIIIVDTDAGDVRYKVGDGTKKYSQLPFDDEAIKALIGAKANDSAVVHKTGDETIAGAKSFTSDIVVGQAHIRTNGYLEGTWLKTTAASDSKGNFATLSNGWIYYRTPAEVRGDIGVAAYTATNPALTASSGVCTWTVAHNLNKKVAYHVTEVSSKEDVIPTVVVTNDNTLTIKIASRANIAAGTYQVTIVGVSQ